MPLSKPRLESYHDFSQTEVSKDIQRRIWREEPDFWGQVIPAAFALENTVGAVRERMKFPLSGAPPQPDFNPFDQDLIEGTLFEDFPELLIGVSNKMDFDITLRRAENEQRNLQMVMDSGGKALGAMLLAGGFDLVNLLPVGAGAIGRTASLFRKPFRLGMHQVKRGAQAGLIGNAQAEGILNPLQDFRTAEQAGLNITAGTLLGAMIGTATAVPAIMRARVLKDLEADFGNAYPREARPYDLFGEEKPIAKTDLRSGAVKHELVQADDGSFVPQTEVTPAGEKLSDFSGQMLVANRNKKTGEVWVGERSHLDLFEAKGGKLPKNMDDWEQGFVDPRTQEFFSRSDAFKHRTQMFKGRNRPNVSAAEKTVLKKFGPEAHAVELKGMVDVPPKTLFRKGSTKEERTGTGLLDKAEARVRVAGIAVIDANNARAKKRKAVGDNIKVLRKRLKEAELAEMGPEVIAGAKKDLADAIEAGKFDDDARIAKENEPHEAALAEFKVANKELHALEDLEAGEFISTSFLMSAAEGTVVNPQRPILGIRNPPKGVDPWVWTASTGTRNGEPLHTTTFMPVTELDRILSEIGAEKIISDVPTGIKDLDAIQTLKQRFPGKFMTAWKNPASGEVKTGGAFHFNLVTEREIDVLDSSALLGQGKPDIKVKLHEVPGLMLKARRMQRASGFWDVDRAEFVTREVAGKRSKGQGETISMNIRGKLGGLSTNKTQQQVITVIKGRTHANSNALEFRRPRLYVEITNPKRATPDVKAEMKVVAFVGEESLSHVRALEGMQSGRSATFDAQVDSVGNAMEGMLIHELPVEIIAVKTSKRGDVQLLGKEYEFVKFPKGKVPKAVSLGRLNGIDGKTAYTLERSITCSSPCKIVTNEDILNEGDTVPGGYHTDGRVGVSAKAERMDTEGTYNPDVEATSEEIVGALGFEHLVKEWFPATRAATNPELQVRQVMPKMIDIGLRKEKFKDGISDPRSAQSGIRLWNKDLGELVQTYQNDYLNYRRRLSGKKPMRFQGIEANIAALKNMTKGPPEGELTEQAFRMEVTHAARRDKAGEPGSSDPDIMNSVKAFRRYDDKVADALEEVGLMNRIDRTDPATGEPTTQVFSPEGRVTGNSHVKRIYLKKLLSRPEEERLWVEQVVKDWTDYYGMDDIDTFILAAKQARDNILATPSGRVPETHIPVFSEVFSKPDLDQNRLPGMVRPRTLDVMDVSIERWLEPDILRITHHIHRSAVADIEIAKNFGRFEIEGLSFTPFPKGLQDTHGGHVLPAFKSAKTGQIKAGGNTLKDLASKGEQQSNVRNALDKKLEGDDELNGPGWWNVDEKTFHAKKGTETRLAAETRIMGEANHRKFKSTEPQLMVRTTEGKEIGNAGRRQWVGDPNATAALRNLDEKIKRRVERMTEEGQESEKILRYERKARQGIRDIAAVRDILRGQYAVPANPEHAAYVSMRVLKQFNYWTMGGGFMVSSIPDLGRIVAMNGLENTFRTQLAYMGLPEATKAALRVENVWAGVGMETILNRRASNIMDLGTDYGRMTNIEQGMRSVSDRFSYLSGLSVWNDTLKQFSAIYSGQNFAHHIRAWAAGDASPEMIEQLAAWGFGDFGIVKRIDAELAKQPVERGLTILNTPKWTDLEAQNAFRLALGKQVDATIITPGPGDVSLWINTQVGGFVGQFKRFGMAATKFVALSGLQWRDRANMNGALLAIGMGMLVAKFKAEQYGYGVGDTRELLLSAIDRSGLLGMIPDIDQSLGLASRGALAPGQLIFGGHNRYQWTEKDFSDVLMGPTRGTLRSFGKAFSGATKAARGNSSQIRESEIRAAVKLSTPYSLFYLTQVLESIAVKPLNRRFLRERREIKKERQAKFERRKQERRVDPKRRNTENLKRGDYTFMEMKFEDEGTDGMLDFLEERMEFLHGNRFKFHPQIRQRLRAGFNPQNLAALKGASDRGGAPGMVKYLTAQAEGLA